MMMFRCSVIPVFVLVWHGLVASSMGQTTDLAALPHRRVCTSEFTAMDHCGPSNSSIDGYSGYELDLFIQVADMLAAQGHTEWARGNWSFTCLDTQPCTGCAAVWGKLCEVVVKGHTSLELANKGYVKFSYSTYQSGRRILLHQGNATNMWTFLHPFHVGVWGLMFGAAVAVALFVLLLEAPWAQQVATCVVDHCNGTSIQHHGPVFGSGTFIKLRTLLWAVVGMMVHSVHQLSPSSTGSRTVVLGTAFTALILACMYTSAYTAQITVNSLNKQITSMSDLTSLPVGIVHDDEKDLRAYGLQDVKLLPWVTLEDERSMLQMLRSGEIAALIVDNAWADYQSSVNCDLVEVGQVVLPTNQGFMFGPPVPDAYIALFDYALQTLESRGVMKELVSKYIRVPSQCPYQRSTATISTQIKLQDVGGVWIFVASSIGLGALVHLITWLVTKRRQAQQQQHQELPMTDAKGPSAPARHVHPAFEDATTVDERIQAIDERMNRVAQQLQALPMVFGATMDHQLHELCNEVAAVLVRSTLVKETSRLKSSEPFPSEASGNPPGTPGSLAEHLALITSKFHKMQDSQQK